MGKRKMPARRATHRDALVEQVDALSRRVDGWNNVLTGLGTNYDKRRSTKFEHKRKIADNQLTAIYRANGFGRRVIDLPADDMTRNWLKITNDDDDKAAQKLEDLAAQRKLNRGMKLGRLYGGALVLMGINDGQKLDQPVKPDKIKSVDYLTVFDRRDLTVESEDIETNVATGRFGEPRLYTVQARFGGETFKVHASRVIRFDGSELAWSEYEGNQYWMDSVLESCYEHIRQLGAVFDSAEFIVESFVMTVVKIKNLFQLIAAGKDALIKQRLDWFDMARHVANTELLDADEDYAKHSSTVQGLDALLDRFMMGVSAASGIPVTLLMGRSPAGQNATGEADLRFYYDKIRSGQRNEFGPAIEPLIKAIWASEGFSEPDTWSIEFNPLHEMTAAELAEHYKQTAEGDAIYVLNQMIDPDVLGRYRFVGDHYNSAPPSFTEEEYLGDEEDERVEDVPPAPPPQPPVPGQTGSVPPATPPAAAE